MDPLCDHRSASRLRAASLGCVLLALAAAGCAGGERDRAEKSDGASHTGSTVQQTALGLEQLRNASYPLLGAGSGLVVRLSDGEYVDEPKRTRALLGERWIAHGDLDGDGNDEAAVVLYYDTGGSGNFREFLVLHAPDGEPVVLGGVFAGDRVRIESFRIEAGVLEVEMVVHRAEDPLCCPTLRVRDRYALRGGELVRTEREELGSVAP